MTDQHSPVISGFLGPRHGVRATRWVHEVACRDCGVCSVDNRVMPDELEDFTARVLMAHKTPEHEARLTAHVLVMSDVRGIPSHGVARLGRYISGIKAGHILPGVQMRIEEPAPAVGIVDACNGLGQVAGDIANKLAIKKAKDNGIGVVTVKNSNHYGIAGYYVLDAIAEGLIGMSLTNSAPLVVPTHGAEILLGTNPIAFGAPAKKHPDFLLDMATSVVPRGKIEVYDRNRKQMPVGWAVDDTGYDCQNPGQILKNLIERSGGGILPLGGRGEEFSGYKGYGLAFLVDILSGVLSGAGFGPEVDDVHRPRESTEPAFPNVGHFFLAIDVRRFMPMDQFEARLDALIDQIKDSKKALDQERIFIHGEKEFARAAVHREVGIPMAENVLNTMRELGRAVGVTQLRTLSGTKECQFADATKAGGRID